VAARMSMRLELFVADHDVSVGFYTRVLGFVVRRRDDEYVSLTCGDVTLGLGLVRNLPEAGEGPGFSQTQVARARGAGVEIVLETTALNRLHRRVVAAGYPLAEPMHDRPWGLRDFRLVDPDGYYLRLTTPG
jgi:lactoylglutathione lyase